jgi:hypothetical protein
MNAPESLPGRFNFDRDKGEDSTLIRRRPTKSTPEEVPYLSGAGALFFRLSYEEQGPPGAEIDFKALNRHGK